MIHNRIRRPEFPMKHDYLALMLGVHRPSISTAAKMLQTAGLIRYSRGTMNILDARGLAEGACECLELMETQFDKIFEQPWRGLVASEDGRRSVQ